MSFDRETKVIYPSDDPSVESSSDPFVTLVVDLEGGDRRSAAQLKRQLEEQEISSASDLCKKFNVRVTGQFRDADGKTQTVNIPAVDEETFTPDGLTKANESLRALYVSHVVFGQLAKQTGGVGFEPLSTGEVERLKSTIALIESADNGGSNA